MSSADVFLHKLAPGHAQFFFQALHDRDKTQRPHEFRGTLELCEPELRRLNALGYGIFVQINENDGDGTGNANIIRFRALFADLDKGLPAGSFPVKPTMLVQSSPGKYQAYWVFTVPIEATEITRRLYRGALKGLVSKLGADEACVDERRILRLPSFTHHKREPFITDLIA